MSVICVIKVQKTEISCFSLVLLSKRYGGIFYWYVVFDRPVGDWVIEPDYTEKSAKRGFAATVLRLAQCSCIYVIRQETNRRIHAKKSSTDHSINSLQTY